MLLNVLYKHILCEVETHQGFGTLVLSENDGVNNTSQL